MAKRKKTKSKAKRIYFASSRSKKKKAAARGESRPVLVAILKVFAAVCVLAGFGVGLYFAQRYVRAVTGIDRKYGFLELLDVPQWVTDRLKDKIYFAAGTDAEDFRLDDDAARTVAQNLRDNVAWLSNLKVQVTHEKVRIKADYRKPIAIVKLGLQKFYVDEQLVVLDYLPMPHLPIVRVTGVSVMTMPSAGQVFEKDDLAAAVQVLKFLSQMDEQITPDKPLLNEIDTIDVSNFAGRQSSTAAHIMLYCKDRTQIIWGAEVGMWHRHLEPKDTDKLAMLYGFYEQNGTLLDTVKCIELRQPQKTIPQPIDRY